MIPWASGPMTRMAGVYSAPHETPDHPRRRRPLPPLRHACENAAEDVAGRARRARRIHSRRRRQLPRPLAEAEAARLLAERGLDRRRSDHLRPALAIRAAREDHPRADRLAS